MGFINEVLEALTDYPGHYRRVWQAAYGYRFPRGGQNQNLNKYSDAYARVVFSRLRKRGFAKEEGGVWRITELGKKYARKFRLPPHTEKVAPTKTKSVIIVFDVPEHVRKKRNWLRQELVCLGFTKLQQSVWLGPAPFPREFLASLKELGLLRFIKFFEAKEKDII